MANIARVSHVEGVEIPCEAGVLNGDLVVPARARGIVIFAHGSGSSRLSARNRFVAGALQRAEIGTLLMDLLTMQEERREQAGAMLRFDVALLAQRLASAARWLRTTSVGRDQPIGYFGASTGAAAALIACAVHEPYDVAAVVSRGGRPDLAGSDILSDVRAPTLLLVGGDDYDVLGLNRAAYAHLRCERRLEIIKGATHLFEEPGTLEEVTDYARDWFLRFMPAREAAQATERQSRSL